MQTTKTQRQDKKNVFPEVWRVTDSLEPGMDTREGVCMCLHDFLCPLPLQITLSTYNTLCIFKVLYKHELIKPNCACEVDNKDYYPHFHRILGITERNK